ncbi:hypothetical protein [Calothrix sp. 336/3]|nr:hypothetical protein [Calothrix sp. 336/3]
MKLSYVERLGERGNRERVYEFVENQDGRDEVYQRWQSRYGSGVHH